jgi:hypothetical protein
MAHYLFSYQSKKKTIDKSARFAPIFLNKKSKHQKTNDKQYPNSKFQKIPLTPFKKGEKQVLTWHEEFYSS